MAISLVALRKTGSEWSTIRHHPWSFWQLPRLEIPKRSQQLPVLVS